MEGMWLRFIRVEEMQNEIEMIQQSRHEHHLGFTEALEPSEQSSLLFMDRGKLCRC